MSMAQKVGMADKGNEMAVINVARQSRKKINTTITARMAPSIRPSMADA